jgi:GNAT superfamily N-acetyltransferase
MSKLRIRAVDGAEQLLVLLDLQLGILPLDRPADTRTGWWWIAYDCARPVGFAGLYPSSRWSDAGYLCRAGVLPEYRGRGLQKRLIRIRERKARELGMTWLISDTYKNPPSTNSLVACGYRMYEPSEPWGAEGVLYWRKRL